MSTNNDNARPFSERHGFGPQHEQLVRADAPQRFRERAMDVVARVGAIREFVSALAEVLLLPPPDEDAALDVLLSARVPRRYREEYLSCPWYRVFDLIQSLVRLLAVSDDQESWRAVDPTPPRADQFEHEINQVMEAEGIGWKLENGKFEFRGDESFERTFTSATTALGLANMPIATSRLREALADLSRIPSPDFAGAINHSIGALEAVARKLRHSNKTFGALLHDLDLPKPMDQAAAKLWSFASQYGRHGDEDRVPGQAEAELCVAVTAALCTYLLAVTDSPPTPQSPDTP